MWTISFATGLKDLAAEQEAASGRVPPVVPDMLKYVERPKHWPVPDATAIWSDAAVWVPWSLWWAYGDRQVLADQFDSMVAHVRRIESLLSPTGLWDGGFQFGDWLDPTAPPEEPFLSKADNGVVATACLYRDAHILREAATLLGRHEDAQHFGSLPNAREPHSTSTTSSLKASSTVMPRRRTRWPSFSGS